MMAGVWRQQRGPDGFDLPVAEVNGGMPGPTWLLTAGVHGDEYEGPEAIRQAIADLAGHTFPGRIIALPIANPMAYAAGLRLTPQDGPAGNLNRLFPGDAAGSLSERWARWLWETFVMRADRLIDLHAGGVTWHFEPLAGFYDDKDAALAAAFGMTLWHMPPIPGVLSHEFRRQRGPALGVELGYGGVRNPALVERARHALVSLVRGDAEAQAEDDEAAATQPPVYGHVDVLSADDGEWIASVWAGEMVLRGEVLGVVSSWNGEQRTNVAAPCDGRVLAVRRLVAVRAGEMVALVGPEEA